MPGRRSTRDGRRGSVRFHTVALGTWRPWLRIMLVAVAALVVWQAEGPVPVPAGAPPVTLGLDARKPVYSVPVRERLVSFAVNVDWGDEYLPGMLSVLAEREVHVTFFPTGRWAAARPDLVRQMVEGGHELGNHGYRHDHPKALTDQQLAELIVRNRELLAELAGVETALFAPPYGELDPRIVRIAADTGHWTIMWTVDTVDWRRPPPEAIVQRVLSR
ncbi:MAG TPA: polysaccharide deacetylase family protein, partial [Limnochordales bacterium]